MIIKKNARRFLAFFYYTPEFREGIWKAKGHMKG